MPVCLIPLPGDYAVTRLPAGSPIPGWADGPGFVSIGRSADELSVICPAGRVPHEAAATPGWSCYQFRGPFDFGETGIALSVIAPLSAAGIPVLLVSTHDTDWLLLRTTDCGRAEPLLAAAGHSIAR